MTKLWGLVAWTVCVFGMGLLVAGVGVRSLTAKASSLGILCLLAGLTVLMVGWWSDDRRMKRALRDDRPRPRIVTIGGGTGFFVFFRGFKKKGVGI